MQKEKVEKKHSKFNLKSYLRGVIRPGEAIEAYRYQVYGGQQQKERQTEKTIKDPKNFAR